MNFDTDTGFRAGNNKTTIDSLPPEMLKNIFLNLNGSDLKSARLSCKSWTDLIDTLIPRSVVLDDRQHGNPEFVKNVVKKKVLIKRASKSGAKKALCYPRNPQALEKFILFGQVHCRLFIKEMLNFQKLETLIIGGETMLKRLHLKQSIYLPNLKKLVLNSAFHGEADYEIDVRSHQITVAKNTMDFLINIWCPNIVEIVIDGDIEQGKIDPGYDWKCTALVNFLSKYGSTLKKLAIGESSVLKTHGLNMQDIVITTLSYLHISFYGSSIDAQNNFWANFTASQKKLKTLNVGALWYRKSHELFSMLPTTLVNLTLYWNLSESKALNAAILGNFTNLERLELTFDGAWGQHLSRFSSLRGCAKLKVLVLEQLLVSAKDLERIPEYLPKLEILYLFACGDPIGKLLCTNAPFGITKSGLNGLLWNMEELVYLHVCPEDFLGDAETTRQMNEQISTIAFTRKGCKGYYVGQEPEWLMESTFNY